MTKVALLVLAVFAAGASQAGWESWLKPSLYRASCEDYNHGERLSNEKGVEGGSWEVPIIPAGAEAIATFERGYWQYITFSTEEKGLVFLPESTGDRPLKSVQASMFLSGYEDYPSVPSTARSALALYAPESEEPCFIGWTADGWQKLQVSSLDPVPEQWYDISMKFMQRADGTVRVQYRLKRQSDGLFVTLHAADDETVVWFPAGGGVSDAVVSKVELRGDGAFRYIAGSEPRRGILISLVPWREMIIDESVGRHGSEDWHWRVFDYDEEVWIDYPKSDGDAYVIDVPDGESYVGLLPKGQGSADMEVVEFTACFTAPNDNDATPDDACAIVRIVELPMTNVTQVALDYQFACFANGGWHTNKNTNIKADVNTDYTVEIKLDRANQTVSYRIKKGRGAEAEAYQDLLLDAPVSIGDPLFTFFGGLGKVYSIKSSGEGSK